MAMGIATWIIPPNLLGSSARSTTALFLQCIAEQEHNKISNGGMTAVADLRCRISILEKQLGSYKTLHQPTGTYLTF
ncbi:hypothetical protein F5X99DRAFT_400060 [Biscogniauxia marginata]|nr:hypothetical protein F5X99DRAFT_400060 [Biscogniauxia marginata]